jgi:7,8-dihydropterin-6-yl-methyl-4-(beta-D-ribofuranosyl)aminobenzene 5'-phosphate synthase
MLRIKVLVEDTAPSRGHLGEHGFSLLLEGGEEAVLFDVGQGLAILHNARALEVDWEKIKKVVISHGHYDHTGGLPQVLSQIRPEVFLHPEAASPRFKRTRQGEIIGIGPPWKAEDLEKMGALLHFHSSSVEIAKGMSLTGPISRRHLIEAPTEDFLVPQGDGFSSDLFPDDQALIVEDEQGLVVILGCCHAGLINTLDYARELTGRDRIQAVIGGTHLLGASSERICWTIEALSKMDIPQLALSHCTGFVASAQLHQAFGSRVRPLNVGHILEIGE